MVGRPSSGARGGASSRAPRCGSGRRTRRRRRTEKLWTGPVAVLVQNICLFVGLISRRTAKETHAI